MGPVPPVAREAMEREAATSGVEVTWTRLSEYLDTVERAGCTQNVASLIGAETMRLHGVGYDDRRGHPRRARHDARDRRRGDGRRRPRHRVVADLRARQLRPDRGARRPLRGRRPVRRHLRLARPGRGCRAPARDRGAARDRPPLRGARGDVAPEGGRSAALAVDEAGARHAPGRPRRRRTDRRRRVPLHPQRHRTGLHGPRSLARGRRRCPVRPARGPGVRREIRADLVALGRYGDTPSADDVLLLRLRHPDNARWQGHTLAEIAADRGQDPVDVALDVLASERTHGVHGVPLDE